MTVIVKDQTNATLKNVFYFVVKIILSQVDRVAIYIQSSNH